MCESKRFHVAATITVFLAVLGVCGTVQGKIIYVDPAAVGANDGSSWSDAYNWLQDAMVDVDASLKPVEVRVAQGVYRPDQGATVTQGDKSATFQLTDGVTIGGGEDKHTAREAFRMNGGVVVRLRLNEIDKQDHEKLQIKNRQ